MCPVDFSEASTAALDDAASLAQQLGAQLLIVYVDERPLLSGAASSSLARAMADRRARLEQMTPHVDGVVYDHYYVRGKVAAEIVRFARIHNVDIVVMGRQIGEPRFHDRRDGLCQLVARECRCPVITISHAPVPLPWAC
jgi:nucleotide-binding universal stress UspA family protein